ncbi:MAG TPA: DUF3817 domain-containing protein [Mycobacteriales bacterium]|nr:DUF3817 domain-containing protein [Mycobacteriales bacterium]
MSGALARYRVLAWVVGVVLLLLSVVAMPLKYLGDDPRLVETVGPLHGALYAVYLVVAIDLGRRRRWSAGKTLLVLLAGTVPFISFVAERRISHEPS